LKQYLKDYTFLFSVAGIIVVLDQWTKNLVRDNLSIGEMWVPWEWLAPYARIIHWQNSGAAFGLGQNLSLVFATLAFVVVGAILYYFPKVERNNYLIRIALGMQMGGALGNLIDRLTQNMHVTDFVSIGKFAVWNIADASIFVGTIILIFGVWLEDRKSIQTLDEDENHTSETDQSLSREEIKGE
jgi:signal peptidase II